MTDLALYGYRLERWITASWKALTPFVVYGVSEVLAHGPIDLNTPSGIKAALTAFATAVLVYFTRNRPTV